MRMKHLGWAVAALAAVGLVGLKSAEAGSYLVVMLTDDTMNRTYGSPLVVDDASDGDESSGSEGAGSNADEAEEAASSNPNVSKKNDGYGNNNGHGNNVDGVDSSNPGNSKEGEDDSCSGSGECVDDEAGNGNGNK